MQLSNKEREILNLVRQSNRCGTHINCVKISPSNSYEHELAKFNLCWELCKTGRKFITEAIFESYSGRADVLTLAGDVYEVVHSEKETSLLKKEQNYPPELDIHVLGAIKRNCLGNTKCV